MFVAYAMKSNIQAIHNYQPVNNRKMNNQHKFEFYASIKTSYIIKLIMNS